MSSVGIGKLRKELPHALLISDDLQMQALQQKFPSRIACAQGIKSGLDMICIGNNLMAEDEEILKYAESIQNSIKTNPALKARVQESIARVMATKKQFT
jgi:beta-N-acetylhexosaminidase